MILRLSISPLRGLIRRTLKFLLYYLLALPKRKFIATKAKAKAKAKANSNSCQKLDTANTW